jgi:Helix-turn-helix domain
MTSGDACILCSAALAADQGGSSCSPCSRAQDGQISYRPRHGAGFWASSDVVRAVKCRDFGLIMRSFRAACEPSLTQADIGDLLHLSQAQVSRIESGRTAVRDIAKLERWARSLGAPPDLLWFAVSPEPPSERSALGEVLPPEPGPPNPAEGGGTGPSARAALIGPHEVEVVCEATRVFRQIDNRFGGGHARTAVAAFIDTEVDGPLLDGRFARGMRTQFEKVSAEMHHLAGWMSYDVGDETRGRRHLRRALDLATSARDDALVAEMLAAMSHQAAFDRRPDEAIDLALAARRAAHRSGVPALQAESAALEAHGLALRGDPRGCLGALARAERFFLARTADNTPRWMGYFDQAYLSAKFAHALRDLGLSADAERFARASLLMSDGYNRGRLFNTALLATVLAETGKVEESATLAHEAVAMYESVRSTRARRYLRDIGRRLAPFSDSAHVNDFRQAMVRAGLTSRGSNSCS